MYKIQPFLKKENIHELAQFFRSSLGPKGRYKIFVTSGKIFLNKTENFSVYKHSKKNFDWILAEFWLIFGWILAVFWLNFDCI